MNNKLVIILAGVLIACLIGFGAMFYMMWSKINQMNQKPGNPDEAVAKEVLEAKKLGPIQSLEPFIVNLDDPKLRKYLRVTIDLELTDTKSVQLITDRLPQIKDAILSILPSKHYEEITTVEGKSALRIELIKAVNSFFDKEQVKNIYFTEFVIQ
ncbi:MAG: flagellar basal body-associated FliL family protein [Proteobacteria bacterium]|nr:flagellar basal body-associated FliL family protein [Pseudomonadota bacterium]MBU4471510.1 flagellar basal body-associated FliL family protein [Pseudomonadota bacterium]MCG2752516.1 flagellar basal body-associated FliL family protein [Desulfobacteraceae bacterium]